MLDLVPLAGSGRQVVDRDVNIQLASQLLQFELPQPHARSIAAAPVAGDRQALGRGIALAADVLPPAAEGLYGKRGGVMVQPNTDPTSVGGKVVRYRMAPPDPVP